MAGLSWDQLNQRRYVHGMFEKAAQERTNHTVGLDSDDPTDVIFDKLAWSLTPPLPGPKLTPCLVNGMEMLRQDPPDLQRAMVTGRIWYRIPGGERKWKAFFILLKGYFTRDDFNEYDKALQRGQLTERRLYGISCLIAQASWEWWKSMVVLACSNTSKLLTEEEYEILKQEAWASYRKDILREGCGGSDVQPNTQEGELCIWGNKEETRQLEEKRRHLEELFGKVIWKDLELAAELAGVKRKRSQLEDTGVEGTEMKRKRNQTGVEDTEMIELSD